MMLNYVVAGENGTKMLIEEIEIKNMFLSPEKRNKKTEKIPN